jgi:type II secretory pathway pseudopilin PulG
MGNESALARRRSAASGFSLLDLMITVVVLAIALAGFAQTLASANRATATLNEEALAKEAARGMLEELRAADFATLFATYNGDATDDPEGPGTAAGDSFEVASLTPLPEDADGITGAIVFPTAANDPGELREDVALPSLAMPRDLSGDGAADALDHASDYELLPVIVRVAWRSASGPSVLELRTLLAE